MLYIVLGAVLIILGIAVAVGSAVLLNRYYKKYFD